jgi:hypothetical protein
MTWVDVESFAAAMLGSLEHPPTDDPELFQNQRVALGVGGGLRHGLDLLTELRMSRNL